ncbi:MAG: CBS domain-containing protein [Candidatus Hodarchaeales archaeon]
MSKEKEFLVQDLTIDDEYDTVSANASVQEAAKKMKENGIPDLVVLDDNNMYQGVIADFDIVTNMVAEGLSSESKVTELMYTIEPVSKDTTVSDAFARMRDLDVSVVPVVDNDKVIGVATITDCWGYLPEKYEDQKGLIAVSNPRFANYSFTIFMSILFLFFGIFAPLVGIVGYLKAPIASQGSFTATYYLFEARGASFWTRYIDIQGQFSLFWFGLTIYGVLFVILGLVSIYAIFQWAYSDYKMIKVTRNWHAIGTLLGLVGVIVEWLIFTSFILMDVLRVSNAQFDFGGVLFSLLAMLCLIAAVSRDYLFRERSTASKGA